MIVAASRIAHKIYNVADGELVGKNILFFAENEYRANRFNQTLAYCFTQKKEFKFLSVRFARRKEYRMAVVAYYPIINRTTGDVVGFKYTGSVPDLPINLYALSQVLSSITTKQRNNAKELSDDRLTNLEHEIVYLAFQCDSYQEIADLLSLAHGKKFSRDKVAKIILRNLYSKFDVLNFDKLKEKAHALGYHKKLPANLFGEFVYPLEKL